MRRCPLPPAFSGTKQDTRWRKGQSGNPAGKAKGARHQALIALDLVGQEAAVDIMRSVVAEALAGDMRAADILLARLWPVRRGCPVRLDLPTIKTASDLAQALAIVVQAVGAGHLTPEEAASVSAVLEMQRRAIELGDLENRITALENAHGKRP